jgi:hypothetical protein
VSRLGPKTLVDADVLVDFLDDHSDYETSGRPCRTRKTINGVPVSESDARMIRRWRAGTYKGVTKLSALALLRRHNLDLNDL